MINNIKKNRAFVILFAVTLSALLLAIALGISNIAFRELKFSTNARDTNDAFFAADTGAEYALFSDKNGDFCPPNTLCSSFPIPELGSGGQGCAIVTVDKRFSFPCGSFDCTTTIISKGYNVGSPDCDSSSSNLVEREIKVTY